MEEMTEAEFREAVRNEITAVHPGADADRATDMVFQYRDLSDRIQGLLDGFNGEMSGTLDLPTFRAVHDSINELCFATTFGLIHTGRG